MFLGTDRLLRCRGGGGVDVFSSKSTNTKKYPPPKTYPPMQLQFLYRTTPPSPLAACVLNVENGLGENEEA